MRLQTKLVAVRKIHSTVPRSNFSVADLERAAQAILQSQGTINPLILRPLDWQSYQVVSDHFGYYAAVRARELDLAKGEMIQAIILEEENEGAILEQMKLFRDSVRLDPQTSPQPDYSLDPEPVISTRLTSLTPDDLTAILEHLDRNLIAQISSPQPMIESLEQKLIAKIEAMERQQTVWQQEMMTLLQSRPTPPPVPPSPRPISPPAQALPKINLNTATITDLCRVKGLGKQKAQAIIARRNNQGPFTDLQELIEIAGITQNTMNKYDFALYFTVG
ncbi:helix-hairpin-helix domain-containing protein [Spirulina sp. CCNP1310]|uniref:ComEA family DNA-binding protein n=1 Tax=Spirulina sp. CCNP1310 TaxID=3110249 RepID=UPI002B1FC802|nr:helix-hairpin-helix domain-containing protein [Spirulina sp. CCNP1310]MEA5420964.1 helix-hairpin-helix domain-containing protein [Spirulina sp. CCNP1310]